MDNFISIVFDEKPDSKFSRTFLACFENLNESLLEDETDYVVFESTGNKTVYRISISESPNDAEADKLADHLYTHLYTQGYDNFDIEITEGIQESNPFTDARMNAIKAGKDTFTIGGKTYKVTGDTSDEEAADEEPLDERQRLDPKCWKGYRKDGTKMIDGVRVNNCVKIGEGEYTWEGDLEMLYDDEEMLDEAEYQGRTVKLGKPMRGDVKKFKVYVKNPKGNVVKVNFGDPNMRIKKSNPARRRSFRARHNCDSPGPRHKARYWSCRKW
jgi:hypothetical protein